MSSSPSDTEQCPAQQSVSPIYQSAKHMLTLQYVRGSTAEQFHQLSSTATFTAALLLQSYAPFEDMLQRNDSVNVSALAAAYVESFNAQLLPDEHALEAGAAQDQPAGEWPAQADSHSISADAASEGADKQCLGAAVTLPTFKDLVDDLRSQLKDINGLDDKVWAGST